MLLIAVAISACNGGGVYVVKIEIGGEFTDRYFVGQEFENAGIRLYLTYSDKKESNVLLSEVKAEAKILGFSTKQEAKDLLVTVLYKNVEAHFLVDVISEHDTKLSYTVSFDTQGGSLVPSKSVTALEYCSRPQDVPEREGFFFINWYEESAQVNLFDFETTRIMRNTTVYAGWGEMITVSFLPPDYLTEADKDDPLWFEPIVQTVRSGATVSVPVPSKVGFTGQWDYNGQWNNLTNGQKIHAIYNQDEYSLTVIFRTQTNPSLAITYPQRFTYGSNANDNAQLINSLTEDINNPLNTRDHMVISGFRNSASSSDRESGLDGYGRFLNNITGNLTLEVEYDWIEYNVNFNFNQAGIASQAIKVRVNLNIPTNAMPSTPVVENYRFGGWYLNEGLTLPFENHEVFVSSDMTLYARWILQIEVLFHLHQKADLCECGENIHKAVIDRGGSVTPTLRPALPEIEGHTVSWVTYDNLNAEHPPVWNNITSGFTVYTKAVIQSFTVRFTVVINGVVEDWDIQTVAWGNSATAPANNPQLENQIFEGWDLSVPFDSVKSNLVISAIFAPVRIMVTFRITQNQSDSVFRQVIAGTAIPEDLYPNEPREDYEFDGWFTTESFATPWNKDTIITEAGIVIYAKWTRLYRLTFAYRTNTSGQSLSGSAERRVREGEQLQDIPTEELLLVNGERGHWTLDGNPFFFQGMPITRNMSFIAEYEKILYVVTYRYNDANGTSLVYTIQDNYHWGDRIEAPFGVPQRDGATFNGWIGLISGETECRGNMTFDADFIVEAYRVVFYIPLEDGSYLDYPSCTDCPDNCIYHFMFPISHGGRATEPSGNYKTMYTSQGLRFSGWADISGNSVSLDNIITSAIGFYARYSQMELDVIFVNRAGVTWRTERVIFGETMEEPILDEFGYDFIGWVTERFTSNLFDFLNTPITQPLTLYLFNQPAVFTINLALYGGYMQSGNSALTTRFNSPLARPQDPLRFDSGKEMAFLGWFTDSEYASRYNFQSPVLTEFTLHAKWADFQIGTAGIIYEFDSNLQAFAVAEISLSGIVTVASHAVHEDNIRYPVTSIGAGAVANNRNITGIVLPLTLTRISSSAFLGCTELTSIFIPSGVVEISQDAFSGCINLTTVTFGTHSELTVIGGGAFAGAVNLYDIDLSQTKLATIGALAFLNCTALKTIELPATVMSVGENCFRNAQGLMWAKFNSVFMPNMGLNAFFNTQESFRVYVNHISNYTVAIATQSPARAGWLDLILSGRVLNYEVASQPFEFQRTFVWEDTWVYEFVMSNNLLSVHLVQYLLKDTEVEVPTTLLIAGQTLPVASLGEYVFDKTVTKISLNTGVELSENTLTSAKGLTHLVLTIGGMLIPFVDGNKTWFYNAFISADINTLSLTVSGGMRLYDIFGNQPPTGLKTVNLLNGTTVGSGMFEGASSIETVNLPLELTTIGENAFSGCSQLTAVNLPFETIGSGSNAVIAYSLREIGAGAFKDCTKLMLTTGLVVPTSVTEIGFDAFRNSGILNNYSGVNNRFVILGDAILYAYIENDNDYEEVIIPMMVKRISERAFANSRMRSITFQATDGLVANELTHIAPYAFSHCLNLEIMLLPARLIEIGDYAFNRCDRLNKVVFFSPSATDIGAHTFGGLMADFEIFAMFTKPATAEWNGLTVNTVVNLFADFRYVVSDLDGSSSGFDLISQHSSRHITGGGYMREFTLGNFIEAGVPRVVGRVRNYAFPRTTEALTLYSATPFLENSLAGLYNLRELSITDTAVASNEAKTNNQGYFHALITRNSKLTELYLDGLVPVLSVFGNRALPSHVSAVGFISSTVSIVSGMFANCQNVSEIIFSRVANQTALLSGIQGGAFAGSGWERQFDGGFVFITLGGIKLIVDYRGNDNIITVDGNENIYINRGAFSGKHGIEVVYIGESVSTVFGGAFSNMNSLIKVFVERNGSLSVFGGAPVFSGNNHSVELFVKGANISDYLSWQNVAEVSDIDNLAFVDGFVFDISLSPSQAKLVLYEGGGANLTLKESYLGSNGVSYTLAEIGANFMLKSVTSLSLPVNLNLNYNAFSNTDSLRNLTVSGISGSTAVLGSFSEKLIELFSENAGLSSFGYSGALPLATVLNISNLSALPASLTSITATGESLKIAENFLLGASGIQTVVISEEVTSVGILAFEGTGWFNQASQRNPFVLLLGGKLLYKYTGTGVLDITIPQSVEVVNSRAFSSYNFANGNWIGNSEIRHIEFAGGSVAYEIGEFAFDGCLSLSTLDMPATMFRVSPSAFNGTFMAQQAVASGMLIASGKVSDMLVRYTGSVANVVIPQGVVYIAEGAFMNNTTLTSISFAQGSRITKIWDHAFFGCANLASVNFDGLTNLIYIGNNAFSGTLWYNNNSGSVKYQIGTTGNYRLVLYNSAGNPIIGIGDYSNIAEISAGAFGSMPNGFTITFATAVPPDIEKGTLDRAGEIFVPAYALEDYKSLWREYAEMGIIKPLP